MGKGTDPSNDPHRGAAGARAPGPGGITGRSSARIRNLLSLCNPHPEKCRDLPKGIQVSDPGPVFLPVSHPQGRKVHRCPAPARPLHGPASPSTGGPSTPPPRGGCRPSRSCRSSRRCSCPAPRPAGGGLLSFLQHLSPNFARPLRPPCFFILSSF